MCDANQKKCWTYPCISALMWMPIVSIIFIFQKDYIAAFAASIFFALGVGYVLEYAPWKLPDMPVRKLYLGYVAIFIVSAISTMYLWYPEEFCKIRNISSWIGFFPLFIPFFLFKNKNWSEMQSSKKKIKRIKQKTLRRPKKTPQLRSGQATKTKKTTKKTPRLRAGQATKTKKTTKKTPRLRSGQAAKKTQNKKQKRASS